MKTSMKIRGKEALTMECLGNQNCILVATDGTDTGIVRLHLDRTDLDDLIENLTALRSYAKRRDR